MTMDPFERDLKDALRREEPSGDFTARVLAHVAREQSRQPWWRTWIAGPRLRWATAMVLCFVVLAGFLVQRKRARERAEGEAAREQVMLALHIAGSKVKLAQTKVQQISERDRSSRRN